MDEEEQEAFQVAGRVLADEQKTSLARDYDRMMADQADGAA